MKKSLLLAFLALFVAVVFSSGFSSHQTLAQVSNIPECNYGEFFNYSSPGDASNAAYDMNQNCPYISCFEYDSEEGSSVLCYDAEVDVACNSAENDCSQYNVGISHDGGACSATVPPDPSYLGQQCSESSACGTNYGTLDCKVNCSATAPSVPGNYGQACPSAANACGMTQDNGTYQCDSSCSSTPPSNSLCTAPDLTAGGITPGSATAGVAQTFSATVSNIGNASAGATETLFQVDTVADVNNASYAALQMFNANEPALGTGANEVVSASWTPPAANSYDMRACGNYYTNGVFQEDSPGSVVESNYSNNCGPWTLVTVVSPPEPNPVGTTVTPITATVGVPVTFVGGITNEGTASTGTTFPNYFIITSTPGDGAGDVFDNNIVAGPLAVNQSTTITDPPYSFTSSGTFYGIVCGDYGPGWVRTLNDLTLGCGSPVPIIVAPAPPPAPSCSSSLAASPSSIVVGNSTTLSWNCSNASSCQFVDDGVSRSANGTRSVSPSSTVSYQLSCTGPGGTGNSNPVTVTVIQPQAFITANPIRVPSGTTSVIADSASNVTSCRVTGTDGYSSSAMAGPTVATTTVSRTITAQTTYTISCTTPHSGTISSSVIVNVNGVFNEF